MRRTTSMTAAVVVGLAGLAMTPHADAAQHSPGCVTRAEYRAVHKGGTKAHVDHVWGTHGHKVAGARSGGFRTSVWNYRTCSRFSAVAVSYDGHGSGPLRLSYKTAVWVS